MNKPPSAEERAARIRERAQHLWEEAGRPAAGAEAFEEEAAQLLAIERAPQAGTIPLSASLNEPDAEPIEALENQGEFPTPDRSGRGKLRAATPQRPPAGAGLTGIPQPTASSWVLAGSSVEVLPMEWFHGSCCHFCR